MKKQNIKKELERAERIFLRKEREHNQYIVIPGKKWEKWNARNWFIKLFLKEPYEIGSPKRVHIVEDYMISKQFLADCKIAYKTSNADLLNSYAGDPLVG